MNELLDMVLQAHGGLSRWREIEAFRLKVSIGGGQGKLITGETLLIAGGLR